MLLFNVILTSLPVISLGVFEQDVSSEVCLQVSSVSNAHSSISSMFLLPCTYTSIHNAFFQFPALYQQGPRNLFFDWYRILGWMGNGVYSSLVIFFLNIIIFYDQAFRAGGQTADMATVGTTMFTCIIWAVNCQIALTMSHFTWIQHLFVWGSIVTWYLFLILYGMTSPLISGNAYQLLVEVLGPAPIYWAATLLVTIACNLPYFAHISFQKCFNPTDHHVIQEIKYYKKDIEDQRMWTRERSKARQDTKIGFTARVEAKIRHLRGRLQKKHSNLVAS
jgi:phospholipid-translocating ATPase